MRELAKVIAAIPTRSVEVVPVEVVTVSPLTVRLNGAVVPGIAVDGLTYTVGPAVAIWSSPATPIVFPTV